MAIFYYILRNISYLEKTYREIKDDPSLIYCLGVLFIIQQDDLKAKVAMNDLAKLQGENHPLYKQLKALFEKHVNK